MAFLSAPRHRVVVSGAETTKASLASSREARHAAAGVSLIDTADIYSLGLAEEIVGEALERLAAVRADELSPSRCFPITGHELWSQARRRWIIVCGRPQ